MVLLNRKRLTIVETSDIHGHIFPYTYSNKTYVPYGLGLISTYLKNLRKEEECVLVIDNGDIIQGTPLMLYYVKQKNEHQNPIVLAMNDLKYDVAVIGNHEFNYGLDILKKTVEESSFPWLSCNILSNEIKKPYFGTPYVIKEFDDLKIAVLGATTHYIPNWEDPNHIKGLLFEDAYETIKRWVTKIREVEKPDFLIVAYHGGIESDLETGKPTEEPTGENQAYQICQHIEGIDLLLTGHQHRKVIGKINGVPVIQPGANGEAIGKITVEFVKKDGKWKVLNLKPVIEEFHQVEVDSQLLRKIQHYENETQKWLDQTIGYVEGNMQIDNPFQVRTKEHPFIEFVNKVQMHTANVSISCTALLTDEAKGFNQTITVRDIVSNYIFPNTLKVIEVTGEDIKFALERSASYFKIENRELIVNPSFSRPKPQHFNYDMWEGIEYIFDIRKPIGERVVKLYHDGKPIDRKKKYEVVMNNYRAGGGGDYTMFKGKKVKKDIQQDMVEVMIKYILENPQVKATCNNNWEVVW